MHQYRTTADGRTEVWTGKPNAMWAEVPPQAMADLRELQVAHGTEQTLHAAWRKCAEEAEAELIRIREPAR